jgi:hypothetical protein
MNKTIDLVADNVQPGKIAGDGLKKLMNGVKPEDLLKFAAKKIVNAVVESVV